MRSNVTYNAGTSPANTNGRGQLIWSGNSNAYAPLGNTSTGAGSNAFGLRAVLPSDTLRKLVSVSGWQRMPMLQNSPSSTATFNLVRALPNSKGQYLSFDFYDAADGRDDAGNLLTGQVTVLPPLDATGEVTAAGGISGCRAGKDSI